DLPVITAAERDVLIATARSFDLASVRRTQHPVCNPNATIAGLRPGDDFDQRGPTWCEILERHGWERAHSRGEVVYWRRPGKETPGISATTGYCKGQGGIELLAVFSSNAHPFEGPNGTKPCTCYSKFAAHALLNHQGDFKAAAAELRHRGYGAQRYP